MEDNRSMVQAYQNHFYVFQGCTVHLEIIKVPLLCVYFKRLSLWNDLRLQTVAHSPAEEGCFLNAPQEASRPQEHPPKVSLEQKEALLPILNTLPPPQAEGRKGAKRNRKEEQWGKGTKGLHQTQRQSLIYLQMGEGEPSTKLVPLFTELL